MTISGISSFAALQAPALQPARAPNHVVRDPSQQQGDDDGSSEDRLELSPAGRAALSSSGKELTPEEQKQVVKLKARDAEVRQHEAAHQATAGGLSRGGASFDYERGPDGRQYAVGGEVQIDTSSDEGNPEATISKLQQVRAAALAPADPSGQDRAVAAQAAAGIARAEAQKAEQNKQGGDAPKGGAPASETSQSGSSSESSAARARSADRKDVASDRRFAAATGENGAADEVGELLDLRA